MPVGPRCVFIASMDVDLAGAWMELHASTPGRQGTVRGSENRIEPHRARTTR